MFPKSSSAAASPLTLGETPQSLWELFLRVVFYFSSSCMSADWLQIFYNNYTNQTCQLVRILCSRYAFWPLSTLVRIAALLGRILLHFAVRLFQFLCKFISMKSLLPLRQNNLCVSGVKRFWPIRALHFNTLAHLSVLLNAPCVWSNSVHQGSWPDNWSLFSCLLSLLMQTALQR